MVDEDDLVLILNWVLRMGCESHYVEAFMCQFCSHRSSCKHSVPSSSVLMLTISCLSRI